MIINEFHRQADRLVSKWILEEKPGIPWENTNTLHVLVTKITYLLTDIRRETIIEAAKVMQNEDDRNAVLALFMRTE